MREQYIEKIRPPCKLRRLTWVNIKDGAALFVRAPGTPKFFDPGCRAIQGLYDQTVLFHKMRRELTVTLLAMTMREDTSFRSQAFDKPEDEQIEAHLWFARHWGKPQCTDYVEEIRYLTADDRDMELTSDAGQAYLRHLYSLGLIRGKR